MAIVRRLGMGDDGRRELELLSPATLEPIGKIACMTAEEVRAVVTKAREAQPGWAALRFEDRGESMRKALDVLLQRQDDFIAVIEREGPKPRLDIVNVDIFPTGDALGYYAKNAGAFLGTETVERHVADAVAKGARVLIGGRRNPTLRGLYYEPTVVVDVNHDMLLMTDETFGPVMPIVRVADEDEAIRLANDMAVTFGVCEAPFGGVRQSGIGRSNGEYGLKGYCNVHPVVVDKLSGAVSAGMYPTSVEKARSMQEVCRSVFGARTQESSEEEDPWT